MSKYDSIKTAAELVAEVQAHGLSLAQEDICRAQDIFGRSAVQDHITRRANQMGSAEPIVKAFCCFIFVFRFQK